MNRWYSCAKLPKNYRLVLFKFDALGGMPECMVVGYVNSNRQIITPGAGLKPRPMIVEWCDCLPSGFTYGAMKND